MNKETEVLHCCLEAPSDFTAWKWMKIGSECKLCGFEAKDPNEDEIE